jgi:hypothetical protein
MTFNKRDSQALCRLAMLTLTPADAEIYADQLVQIQGYSEWVDDGVPRHATIVERASNPGLLERPSSVAISTSTA